MSSSLSVDLTVVPAVHHQRVAQPLHDRALRLAEPLGCEPGQVSGSAKWESVDLLTSHEKKIFPPASRVRHVAGIFLLHCDVILHNMVLSVDKRF